MPTNLERTETARAAVSDKDMGKTRGGNEALWQVAFSAANLADDIHRCAYVADDDCAMFRVTQYKAAPQE